METGGYPLGAENDPFAPYNAKENVPKSFDLQVTQTLQANFSVNTSLYVSDYDDDVDYSSTDWNEVFNDTEHHTPSALIGEYRKLATRFLEYVEKHYPDDKNLHKYKKELARLDRESQCYAELETIIEPI